MEVLPYIARAGMGLANSRILKSIQAPVEAEKDILEVERVSEFDIPLDVTRLSIARPEEDGMMALIAPDVDVIILPPSSSSEVKNALGIEGGRLSYCRLESDFDWLTQYHGAFAVWAKENMISGCEKALLLPAHSIVLKSASPVMMLALEAQEKERRRREIDVVRTIQETEEYISRGR